jgi:hypothetical protein
MVTSRTYEKKCDDNTVKNCPGDIKMQISSEWLIKVDQFQFLAVLLHFFDDEFHGRVLREKFQLPYL